MFKQLNILLYFKTYSGFKNRQDDKTTSILQALTSLLKLLVDLSAFLHLGHIFNLDSIAIITLQL